MITTGFYLTSTWETGIYSENCYGDTAVHRPVSILQSILQYPKPQNSSPPLELGLIKTKKEHSVSVVVFLMVGEGGGQKYSELHLLLPLMSAPLLFHPWAHPQLRKLRATPHATSIRYIVTKNNAREQQTKYRLVISVNDMLFARARSNSNSSNRTLQLDWVPQSPHREPTIPALRLAWRLLRVYKPR